MRFAIAFASIVLASGILTFGDTNSPQVHEALAGIRSKDPAMVQQSIAALRGGGPDGLDALLADYDQNPDPALLPAVDAVAGQHDAIWSRLYWYTDLAQAQAAARQQAKPILYLRLMGKLTDEYSCANSRFFRTVLYANREISGMLRERFILVWVSERPVPVVTIDYGDGRSLKRTLTGNSIHYVLDANGVVYDALPGLFDPATFQRIVGEAGLVARDGISKDRSHYLNRADDAILRQWRVDSQAVNPPLLTIDARLKREAAAADAAAAMRVAVSKRVIEAPMLRGIAPQFAAELDRSLDSLNGQAWPILAASHISDAALDDQSIALIRSQNPALASDPAGLDKMVKQFEETIAEDSVHDNYQLRRDLLAWLRDATGPVALEDLNRRVYTELFQTPRSDPWLGLMPDSLYTALGSDSCCTAAAR